MKKGVNALHPQSIYTFFLDCCYFDFGVVMILAIS
jgi:hypothetical protein